MKLNTGLKFLLFLLAIFVLVICTFLFYPNVKNFQDTKYFYVRTGWTLADMDRELLSQHIIKRPTLYRGAKKILGFKEEDVHVGRYKIPKGCSSYSILHRISKQKEDPVKYEMKNLRTPPQIVAMFYQNTESAEWELKDFFYDKSRLAKMGCDSMSLLATFFRENFEAKWSDSYRDIANKMHQNYLTFWTENNRKSIIEKLGLSEREVMTLASIVQGEIRHDEEAGTVAQVYLNRLRKGMKLQADPTVVYAVGDFQKNRVKYSDLKVNSPFNTYKYAGLPPGPIFTVRREIVDSVLFSNGNGYIFFCADPDRLGYHRFTGDYNEHLKNAKDYQNYLDENNIN